jgi:hypothetical protein
MTENEIIIAHLKAQIIIERERARVLSKYSFNVEFQLHARVCEKLAEELGVKIIAIS